MYIKNTKIILASPNKHLFTVHAVSTTSLSRALLHITTSYHLIMLPSILI